MPIHTLTCQVVIDNGKSEKYLLWGERERCSNIGWGFIVRRECFSWDQQYLHISCCLLNKSICIFNSVKSNPHKHPWHDHHLSKKTRKYWLSHISYQHLVLSNLRVLSTQIQNETSFSRINPWGKTNNNNSTNTSKMLNCCIKHKVSLLSVKLLNFRDVFFESINSPHRQQLKYKHLTQSWNIDTHTLLRSVLYTKTNESQLWKVWNESYHLREDLLLVGAFRVVLSTVLVPLHNRVVFLPICQLSND